jgi:DNA-binding IclR family transcriptional regulator
MAPSDMPEPEGLGPLDPRIASILDALLEAHEHGGSCSAPRLRKRLELPLSVLMRTLTALVDAELIELTSLPDRNVAVALTKAGVAFAREQRGER